MVATFPANKVVLEHSRSGRSPYRIHTYRWMNETMRKIIPSMLALTILLPCVATGADAPDTQRQQELAYLLKHDCGSCHGLRLEGGLGPALVPERLRALSLEQLAGTILHGRPGTPMPPWQPFLSRQDAFWLAARLKRGPDR